MEEQQQQQKAPETPFMVGLLEDTSIVAWGFSGISLFTTISAIGRAYSELSSGIFILFSALHLVAIVGAMICVGVAIGRGDSEQSLLKTVIPACVPVLCFLLLLWLGCGLGAWIGG